jgi:hypothetical protein
MKNVLFGVICLCLASMSMGDIISFNAEDAAYISVAGTNWTTFAYTGAIGGVAIKPITPHGDPMVEAEVRNYEFNIAAGTYDLYARLNKRNGVQDGWVSDGSGLPYINDSAWFSNSSFSSAATLFKFNSMLPDTGIDGVSTIDNFGWVKVDTSFIQAVSGTAYFRAAPREPLLIDGFAFVTQGEAVTDAGLTASIPEPATMVILGLGSLLALKRRK